MSYFKTIKIDTDGPAGDAFGRLRVSNPTVLFDSKQLFDNQPLFWDDQETSGTGTGSTHSVNTASSTMTVSSSTAGTRVRQTFQRFNYIPGRSQLIFLTSRMDVGGTGIVSRIGLFDDNNGLFFENNEGTFNVVARTSTSGSPIDSATPQSSWNIDPMDGTGPSGLTLDITKTNVFVIDFEWLGVGRVRYGITIDGVYYYIHALSTANNLTSAFMSTPNLPLRYEISNDGTGAASSLEHTCSSVASEGEVDNLGIVESITTDGAHVTTNTENTWYAIMGIRLKSTHIGSVIEILSSSIQIQNASQRILWGIFFNPSVSGTFTYGDLDSSSVQFAIGATTNTVTGGKLIQHGFSESAGNSAGGAGSAGFNIKNTLKLGASIDGTRDQIVLCAKPIGGSTAVEIEGGMTWQELD